MRKSLWLIPLLFAVIGAPNAHAQTYDATFTCFTTCVTPVASPMPVSFPVPTIDIFYSTVPTTINVGPFAGTDTHNNSYSYIAAVSGPTCIATNTCFIRVAIFDSTKLDNPISILDVPSCDLTCWNNLFNLQSSGTLSFTSSSSTTPERSSFVLMLTGPYYCFL